MNTVRIASRWLAVVVVVSFAACGGGGGGGGSTQAPAVAASKVFVGDAGLLGDPSITPNPPAIGSSPNSNPSPGPISVPRIVTGPSTMLSTAMWDFALDTFNDRLYVSDLRSILVFNNISTATGNVAPSRVVSSFGGLGNFVGIALDPVNDRLYATVNLGFQTNEVRVFDNVSTANNALPSRTFSFTSDALTDVAIDPNRNVLYVYNSNAGGFRQISVFDNPATLSGAVAANRTIGPLDSYSSGNADGIFVDPVNNRLYSTGCCGVIRVYESANTKNGAVAPDRTITLPGVGSMNLFVELTSDRLYAADSFGLTIVPNASTAAGLVSGVRVLAPTGSKFMAVAVKP